MRPLRWWVVIALPMAAVLLAPALAPGARIVTKSHQTFTGTITEETAQAITIATDSGKVTVPATTIASIQRDTVPGEEPKIVPAPIKAAKAPEAFQNAKAAISAGDWVKAGGLLAGLLKLPTTVFPHENRLAATAALVTCHLQITDLEGASKVFKQRASLVASESDKKRLLATAEALQAAAEESIAGPSLKWQAVQTYDDAIKAGMQSKTDQLLEQAKEIGTNAQSLNKWSSMKRIAQKIVDKLKEADLYAPGFSTMHREEALSTIADNVVQAAEKAIEICTEERKFNITPYYVTSVASVEHARIYNEYVTRYMTRRNAAEDALKNLEQLADEFEAPNIQTKREAKVKELLASLDELRYHEMIKGMKRKLRIMPRRIGTQF